MTYQKQAFWVTAMAMKKFHCGDYYRPAPALGGVEQVHASLPRKTCCLIMAMAMGQKSKPWHLVNPKS
jgi:hypothetical protein